MCSRRNGPTDRQFAEPVGNQNIGDACRQRKIGGCECDPKNANIRYLRRQSKASTILTSSSSAISRWDSFGKGLAGGTGSRFTRAAKVGSQLGMSFKDPPVAVGAGTADPPVDVADFPSLPAIVLDGSAATFFGGGSFVEVSTEEIFLLTAAPAASFDLKDDGLWSSWTLATFISRLASSSLLSMASCGRSPPPAAAAAAAAVAPTPLEVAPPPLESRPGGALKSDDEEEETDILASVLVPSLAPRMPSPSKAERKRTRQRFDCDQRQRRIKKK